MVTIIELVFCHLIGDYVLQCDYIAKTKGDNWYHLFVHCALYCFPFYMLFGATWQLPIIFAMHFIVDVCKSRYKIINYAQDQISHYITILLYFV